MAKFSHWVSPDGRVGTIEADRAEAAIAAGYRPATPEEADAFERRLALRREHDTIGGALLAGLEGAASGLTFGLSTKAQVALGADPEAIRARQEFNPLAHGLGTAFGVAAPLLLSGGAATPAVAAGTAARAGAATTAATTAAAATRAAQVGRAARAAARVAPPTLVTRGSEALAARAIPGTTLRRSIARGALGSTVEGAAYGLGQYVHESALGDPRSVSEHLLATVGLGALLGGGIGAAAGAVSGGALGRIAESGVLTRLRRAAGKTAADDQRDLADRLAEWLREKEAERGLKVVGGIQSSIARALKAFGINKKDRRDRLYEYARAMHEEGIWGAFTTPQKASARAREILEETGASISEFLKGVDAAGGSIDMRRLTQRGREEILEPLQKNPLTSDAVGRIKKIFADYDKIDGSRPVRATRLHEIRKHIDERLFGLRGVQDPVASIEKAALHEWRHIVTDGINDVIESVGRSGDEWRRLNRRYVTAAIAEDFADQAWTRAVGNNLIPLTPLLAGIGGGGLGALATESLVSSLATGAAAYLIREHGSSMLGSAARWGQRALGREIPAFGDPIAMAAARARRGAGRVGSSIADDLGGPGGPPPDASPPPSSPPPPGGGPGPSAPSAPTGAAGGPETRIVTPTRKSGEPASYAVVEADELIPSHNPYGFGPHPDYPKNVQERDYQRDLIERLKVERGATHFDPHFVLSDTLQPIDGPPIVTAGDKRIVLGGNGRTMMMVRAFDDPQKLEAYRQALVQRASHFGIDPSQIRSMRRPVLVRIADDVPADAPPRQLAAASRRFNESLTQQLSAQALAVSQARMLSPQTYTALGELIADAGDKSFRELMASRPLDIINILERDGVITDTNIAEWITGTGAKAQLTQEARDRLEGMLLGRVLGTAERTDATGKALRNKIEKAAPSLVRVEAANAEFSETAIVQAAVDLLNSFERSKLRTTEFDNWLRQADAQLRLDPDVVRMAYLLRDHTQTEILSRFRDWANLSSFDPTQLDLLGAQSHPTRSEVREALFKGIETPDWLGSPTLTASPSTAGDAPAPSQPPAATPRPPEPSPSSFGPPPPEGYEPGGFPAGDPRPEPPIPDDWLTEPPPPPRQPDEEIAALATIERAQQASARRIRDTARAIVNGELGKAARAATLAVGTDLLSMADRARLLAQDPDQLFSAIHQEVEELADHAPALASSVSATMTRGLVYLGETAPASTRPGPLAPPIPPPEYELIDWSRRVLAVSQPLDALRLTDLHPTVLETVRQVYPALYDELLLDMTDALAERTAPLPYQRRLQLSQAFGQDLDGSTTPEAILASQSAYQPQQPAQRAPRPGRLSLADRSSTDTRRVSAGV